MSKAYSVKIPGCIDSVGTTVDGIMAYIFENSGPIDDCVQFELKVILNEIIINAVKHGSLDDQHKYIHIMAGIRHNKEFYLLVKDEGVGFDCHCMQANNIAEEDLDIANLKEDGRGIVIVRSLCDTVKYNRKGNKVLVVKKL